MFDDTIQINQYENTQEVGDTVKNDDVLERIVHDLAEVLERTESPSLTFFFSSISSLFGDADELLAVEH